MFRNRQNFIFENKNSGENMMEGHNILNLKDKSVANQASVAKVVVRRGPQLMVVIAGCPEMSSVEALRQAGVKVGLALSAGELSLAESLDHYSFVFVGLAHKKTSPLKQAVADLAFNGWSIDETFHQQPGMTGPRIENAPAPALAIA